jgi:UDP-N-acetyl-D-glucosamine/UDP-N-acetyl-D-galactosamine dehydrogenase
MTADRKISVTGLGYVGLPVAAAFARQGFSVIAFDVDSERIDELSKGFDRTNELTSDEIKQAALFLTSDPADLRAADFHIVTVPTPIDSALRPDLSALLGAAQTLGSHLKTGDIVVFESTVYPGATEEDCVPVLEAASGLSCGKDFSVGYSPERINPGDKEHRFESISKVVSASDPEALDIVAGVYGRVVSAGIHRAPNIRTAEAAKVIENTQRDLNIALMNELSLIFNRMEIDTGDVLAAASTKWNFLPFSPGLVGGHCIGVDPYYLTHKAEQIGYQPEVILAGRRINGRMGHHVASEVIKHAPHGEGTLRVNVLGLTFKEDVPDFRNTRACDLIKELEEFGADVQVHDPLADKKAAKDTFGIELAEIDAMAPADAVVIAVGHTFYRDQGWPFIRALLKDGAGFVADVRSIMDRDQKPDGVTLWRL